MNPRIDGPAVCRHFDGLVVSHLVSVTNKARRAHLYQVLPKNILRYRSFRQLRRKFVIDDAVPFIDAQGSQLVSKSGCHFVGLTSQQSMM